MKTSLISLLMILLIPAVCSDVFADTFQRPGDRTYLSINTVVRNNSSSEGPFILYSADSSSSLRFQLAAQLRTVFESCDEGEEGDRDETFIMEARRIRITLSGTIGQPSIAYKLHLSTAPGSIELMDFYFNYKFSGCYQVRIGQYKIPFTRYRIQSFQRLVFVDWALTTKYFGAERQMGISVHNGYEKPPKWGYVFGVFSGVNARASHAVGLAKFYDAEIINPSDLSESNSKAEFHPEAAVHLSFNSAEMNVGSASDALLRGWRYSFGLSGAWDMDPDVQQDLAGRFSAEALLKCRGWSFLSVAYAGLAQIGDDAETDPAMLGALMQTAYRMNHRYEVSARYAVVDFRKVLTESDELADVIAQNPDAGQLLRDEEFTIGINIYLKGHSLKWQNDISWLQKRYRTDITTDYTWRSQFQLTF